MADDPWAAVPDAAPVSATAGDAWDSVPNAPVPAQRASLQIPTDVIQTATEMTPKGYWGRIVDAFKSGAVEGYGTDFGFSETNKKWLNDSTNETYKAFVNSAIIPGVAYLDSLWRTPNSIYHAFGDALIEAGVPRDFVSLAGGESSYGSPFQFMRHGPPLTQIKQIPPELKLNVEPKGAFSQEFSLVDESGKTHYRADVTLDPTLKGIRGLGWIENISQEYKGLGPSFYQEIAGELSKSGERLIVGGSASDSAKAVHEKLIAAGRAVTIDADSIRPGLAAEAQQAGEALYEIKQNPIEQAADLGVIGPERPRVNEGTPKEAAEAATQRPALAAAQKDEKITGEPPTQDAWEQRFEHFVGRLETPDDVKGLIRDAARENDNFLPAREGDIPLSHVEDLAEAAGVAPDTVDRRGVGRLMQNDREVRIGMRIMLETTESVKDAARAVKEEASPENLIKLQEALQRRDLAVEQVVGQRAEWGRTGRTFQEFMRDVKDQKSLDEFLKEKGRTPQDLQDIANGIDALDSTQAARVLSDMNRKPPSPFYWTWVNGLISGWLTHTKYVAANASYAVMENGVTPALAAMIGKAKQLFGVESDRVFFGEPMAATWGLINSIPGAAIATAKSIKSGQRAVLQSEIELHKAAIERGEKPPATITRAVNQITGMGKPTEKLFGVVPLDGIWGRIIGAPGDVAMGIHTFFKIMGERAALEAEAYRAAVKEGLDPQGGEFWNRRSEIVQNPTEDMRSRAVANAYKGTFMNELGPHGKAWQKFTKESPFLRWVFPFSHIPINLLKATYEHTPLAVRDSEMRADITGKNGGVAQDKAIARMVVGSSIMGYFVNQALNGRSTGDYPIDPKERDAWKLEGKQPNSILVGNHWVSFNKFGPAGDLANLGANIAAVIPKLTSGDDDAMAQGTFQAANAAARLVVDEVGFLSLAMMFEAIHDEKKGTAWVASQAGSLVPFSSFVGQTASYTDPYMREAKTFFDGIKSKLPFARETLYPKRDNFGEPIANPQYGNILRQREIVSDPVRLEMSRLQIHPANPPDRVGGVKMEPDMYDRYQAVAGALTKSTLDAVVNSPGWKDQPDIVKEMVIRNTISETRKMAAGAMQAANPKLIQQGLKQSMDHILGISHTARPKHAPAVE